MLGSLLVGHGRQPQSDAGIPRARIDAHSAQALAEAMQALSAPSRLLILARLRDGPCPVGELATDVEMSPSAVSHQLRLLRHLGLVTGDRNGRSVVYALYDDHIAHLLDEAAYHLEHRHLGIRDHPPSEEGSPDR
jgi:DNA-binding transcriptional ArsR family regulator